MQIRDWMSVLLAHLIRCPNTISRALDKITPADISSEVSTDLAYLWHCSQEYFRIHQRPISLMFMMAKLEERMRINALTEEEVVRLADFLEWVYNVKEEDLDPGEAAKLIHQLLKQTRVSSKLESMLSEGNDIKDIVDALKVGMDEAAVGMSTPIDPFACLDELYGGKAKPIPLGGPDIRYFNELCSGGIKPGEIMVLIGPMGGYKTTMVIDIMASMASVNQHSMFLAYEQSFISHDLTVRFVSRLSGFSKSFIASDDFRPDKLTEEQKEALRRGQEKMKYLSWYDRSSNIDKVSDIAGQVQEAVRAGKRPSLVVIDQLLPWISRLGFEDTSELRVFGTNVIDELKHQVAERYGTTVIVLHQMTAALVGKNMSKKPAVSDSAEIKGIGMWADFVINLGNFNPENKCFFGIANKARRGEQHCLTLKADGDMGRITIAEDMIPDPRRPGRLIEKGTENVIPVDEGRKPKSNLNPHRDLSEG